MSKTENAIIIVGGLFFFGALIFSIVFFVFILPSIDNGGGDDDNGGGDDDNQIYPDSGSFKVTSVNDYSPDKGKFMSFGKGRSLSYDSNAFNLVSSERIEVSMTAPGNVNVSFLLKTKDGKTGNPVGANIEMNRGTGYSSIGSSSSGKKSASATSTISSLSVKVGDKFALTSIYGNAVGSGSYFKIDYTPPKSPP